MREKTSILRDEIETIWQCEDLDTKKDRLAKLMNSVHFNTVLQKKRLLLDIYKTRFNTELDRLAANCLLKFEGHGVI